MKRFRRSYAILLICLMLVSVIGVSGCKKNGPESSSTSNIATITGKATTAKTTPMQSTTQKTDTSTGTTDKEDTSDNANNQENDDNYEPVDEDNYTGDDDHSGGSNDLPGERIIDFGGKLIKLYAEVALAGEWVLNPNSPLSVMEFSSLDDVEAKYNCKFELKRLTVKNFNEGMAASRLSGLKFADIFRKWSYSTMPAYVVKDLIIPIDEYVDGKGYEERYKGIDWNTKAGYWKGQRYGLIDTPTKVDGTAFIFNTKILDNEGLAYPYEAYWAGTWDWNMMLDYAIKTTKDFNGDGINDQWGIYGDPCYHLIDSNGGSIVAFDEDYNGIYGFDKVQNIRAINFAIELVNTYKVVDLVTTAKFQDGFHALWFSGANNCAGLNSAGFQDYGLVAVPKGPDVDRYISALLSEIVFYFSSAIDPDDVEDLIQIFIDYKSVDDYEPYVLPIEEQRQATINSMLNENMLEARKVYADLYNKQEPVPTRYFGGLRNQTTASVIQPALSMEVPLMTAIGAFREKAQNLIDSFYVK